MLDSLFPPQGSVLLRSSGLETTASCRPCRRLPPATALSLQEHHSSAPANGTSPPWRTRHTSPLLRRPPPPSPSAAAPCAAPQRPAGARRRKAGGQGGRGGGGGGGAPAKARGAAAREQGRRASAVVPHGEERSISLCGHRSSFSWGARD